MLQVLRASLGQGKRLDDILEWHAEAWAPPPTQQRSMRPIGKLLGRLLALDHMNEAWGVWSWMARRRDVNGKPTHSELLLMLRGLNVKGNPQTAQHVLQLYQQAEHWPLPSGPDADYTWHQVQREVACAFGTLGRFDEALHFLERIVYEKSHGRGAIEVKVPLSLSARASMEWKDGPRGWPSLQDEIIYYRSMLALVQEEPEHSGQTESTKETIRVSQHGPGR